MNTATHNGEEVKPVHMLVPVVAPEDEELGAIAAIMYILNVNPRTAGISHALTNVQKERVVRYIAQRYGVMP